MEVTQTQLLLKQLTVLEKMLTHIRMQLVLVVEQEHEHWNYIYRVRSIGESGMLHFSISHDRAYIFGSRVPLVTSSHRALIEKVLDVFNHPGLRVEITEGKNLFQFSVHKILGIWHLVGKKFEKI